MLVGMYIILHEIDRPSNKHPRNTLIKRIKQFYTASWVFFKGVIINCLDIYVRRACSTQALLDSCRAYDWYEIIFKELDTWFEIERHLRISCLRLGNVDFKTLSPT